MEVLTMDNHRKHVGPPGLSRIEDDGRRTAQTIVDATEYERLVAVEKAARELVETVYNEDYHLGSEVAVLVDALNAVLGVAEWTARWAT